MSAPFNPFHQMSVLLGNKHTPSPGSLKNKTFSYLSLSFFLLSQIKCKLRTDNTQIPSSAGMTHVNMHPEVVFLTNICNAAQWVEGTLHCGPGCAANKKRHGTLTKQGMR